MKAMPTRCLGPRTVHRNRIHHCKPRTDFHPIQRSSSIIGEIPLSLSYSYGLTAPVMVHLGKVLPILLLQMGLMVAAVDPSLWTSLTTRLQEIHGRTDGTTRLAHHTRKNSSLILNTHLHLHRLVMDALLQANNTHPYRILRHQRLNSTLLATTTILRNQWQSTLTTKVPRPQPSSIHHSIQ